MAKHRERSEEERYERAVRETTKDTAAPPHEPTAVGRHGTTPAEQREGEPPADRDRQLRADTEEEPAEAPPADTR